MPGPLHRRTFLRGLGTAMALPWLEAMTPLARWAEATTEISSPLRSAFLFIPNGVHQPQWAPSGIGKDWVASPLLESLSAVRDDVLVISGLPIALFLAWAFELTPEGIKPAIELV